MQETILQSVGRTPLVRLRRLAEGLQASVYVKVESLNPGGSIKDRVGVAMIAEAERRGWLRPGGTIIEATAGNTGVGLAMVAAVKGYRCIFVLPDKMSGEKIRLLKAYGAEVVITPTSVAARLARTATTASPTGWPARSPARGGPTSSPTWPTPRSTTAPPAPRSGSRPRAGSPPSSPASAPAAPSPASAGTSRSGTRTSRSSAPTRKARSCPAARRKPWKVEGIGEDFVPKTFNSQLVDDWVRVGDAESFHTARELARREGILLGGSSGTAVAAALRYARRLTAGRPRRRARVPTPAATT